MFTGLIRHQGTLEARCTRGLTIHAPSLRPELSLGDSVAVDGACLTVADLIPEGFRADLLKATADSTTLGQLSIGSQLNLEPALMVGERMGGHFVQGHVDGTVACRQALALPHDHVWLEFALPEWLRPHVLNKGSIAVNGVSLTVQELKPDRFAMQIIPVTDNETNLSTLIPGREVNIEADMIVKTVRMALNQLGLEREGVSSELIKRLGFASRD